MFAASEKTWSRLMEVVSKFDYEYTHHDQPRQSLMHVHIPKMLFYFFNLCCSNVAIRAIPTCTI